jgi:hypothetical protein
MSEYKYTEPPWHTETHDRYDKEFAILGADNRIVALVYNDDRLYEEAEDNAKILTNAPYSFETCRDIYQLIRAVGRSRAKRETGLAEKWWEHLSHLERIAAIYAKRVLDKVQEIEG